MLKQTDTVQEILNKLNFPGGMVYSTLHGDVKARYPSTTLMELIPTYFHIHVDCRMDECIKVIHFNENPSNKHSIPFFVPFHKTYKDVKPWILKKLGLTEFGKIKVFWLNEAFTSKPTQRELEENDELTMSEVNYIGLDHVEKRPSQSTNAIKINK
eukprot:NODE_526_length_6458_cov_1.113854.p5 type:complete len:156 gc:universal NODE_526_length_6458_cov_1.113854:3253-3720(+)